MMKEKNFFLIKKNKKKYKKEKQLKKRNDMPNL